MLREAFADLRIELRVRAEVRAGKFRARQPIKGSEHPGAPWPAPPQCRRREAEPTSEPAEEPVSA